ncbi:MAG: DUF2834 domain-containing protein [Cyanobacteria bacterium P01_D01_bin.128]
MSRRIGLGLLWVSFVAYAFLLAPPDQADTLTLIQRLSTGDWDGINPLIVALFNLMGIWPLVYACLALEDGHGQRAVAWPFVVGSFGLGAFLLLPYLIWRSPNPVFTGEQSGLLKLLDSRVLGVALTLGAGALMAYGLTAGDWADFVAQWQTSRFIHVMSLDFCLLWGLVPTLLGDDMARRGIGNRGVFWLVSLVPLLGAAGYLALRPPLIVPNQLEQTVAG